MSLDYREHNSHLQRLRSILQPQGRENYERAKELGLREKVRQ
jgi:hypothetical protein